MGLKLEVFGIGDDTCSLSGREAECITMTIEDGTVKNSPLSLKSFAALLRMKFKEAKNGTPAVAAPPLASIPMPRPQPIPAATVAPTTPVAQAK